MTKDNQMMPERIWMADKGDDFVDRGQWIDHSGDDDFPVEYIRADTIAAKDRALGVALEALKEGAIAKAAYLGDDYDPAECALQKAIAQIEALKCPQ